jgi:hypothetical protein
VAFVEPRGVFFSDFAVDAQWRAAGSGTPVAVKVLFDAPGAAVLGGEVLLSDYAATFDAATLPQPVARNDTFTIAGTTWRAREAAQAGLDAALAVVPLQKVAP